MIFQLSTTPFTLTFRIYTPLARPAREITVVAECTGCSCNNCPDGLYNCRDAMHCVSTLPGFSAVESGGGGGIGGDSKGERSYVKKILFLQEYFT